MTEIVALLEALQAHIAKMYPVYEASVALRRAESAGVNGESIAEIEANTPAAQRRTSAALMRWRSAVDAAEKPP